ncbi:MAG: valine--tRNA ligase, partial [Anaerolineales bacterium]
IGERHGLEVISVLDESAIINEHGGPYANLDRFEGRKRLWHDMRDAGLVLKEEPYTMKVPRSQRGGEIIEPMVSTQWFVDTKPLADAALKAVRDGRIRIVPERFTKVYYNWLENIQDWCISRQLWWGHRIPVWYCDDCEEVTVARVDPDECSSCNSENIHQETDVLDTWFSSGLWPFSTLGWPIDTPDFQYFYPTTMMETGYDILFFWVARMIMMGLEFTGEVPFKEVYLHGLIRDANGQKMSKTAGNVIDPLEVMDELGTDALRFTLLVGSSPGNDMNLSIDKVEANRNFANKIWNATRFVLSNLDKIPSAPRKTQTWSLADSWIWARLQNLIRDVERLFQNHQYGEAGRQIYDFFWSEFADWYIEIAKLQIDDGGDTAYYSLDTLVKVLDLSFRLLHPFTPFVTEELWQHLKKAVQNSPLADHHADWPQALMITPWPEPREEEGWEEEKISNFAVVMEVVRAIRNLRSEKKVHHKNYISAILVSDSHKHVLLEQSKTVAALARLNHNELHILNSITEKPDGHIAIVVGNVEIYLPLAELVDPVEEQTRLEKELAEVEKQITRLQNLLSSPFSEKAPEDVVQKEREKLEGYLEMSDKLKGQLDIFN